MELERINTLEKELRTELNKDVILSQEISL